MAQVNLVTVTTINRFKAYNGLIPNTATTLYTAPASTDLKIVSLVICNTTTTAANFSLYIQPGGSTVGADHQVFNTVNVPGNGTYFADTPLFLAGLTGGAAADFIAAISGTNNVLNMMINVESYA